MAIELKGGHFTEDPRLDRIYEEDWNSLNYPIMAILASQKAIKFRNRLWTLKDFLDQGKEGRCVEYGIMHELLSFPIRVARAKVKAVEDGKLIYWPAQQEDEWQGGSYPGASPFYEGTSVLAGMKVASRLGFFPEYRWAFTVEDMALAVGNYGPAVIGVNWYPGMFNTDEHGFIAPTGNVAGGHCVCVIGVSVKYTESGALDYDRSHFLIQNSWGKDWGWNGRCKITLRNMARLIGEQGEVAIPVRRSYANAA